MTEEQREMVDCLFAYYLKQMIMHRWRASDGEALALIVSCRQRALNEIFEVKDGRETA